MEPDRLARPGPDVTDASTPAYRIDILLGEHEH
jgi:hypothetical protein